MASIVHCVYYSSVCVCDTNTCTEQYVLAVLYCIVLYCTVLYCIVLYCTMLYCIVLINGQNDLFLTEY